MTQAKIWWQGARPRTLGAGMVPVLVGTAVSGHLIWWRFTAALIVGAGLQLGVNFANDYFDGVRGVDTAERMGPPRLTQSGAASPRAVLVAALISLGTAAVAGLALALATSPILILAVGALALLAALLYSGGPRPYAGLGLGELMVFAFFGLVATCGSAYVMVQTIPAGAWWCGSALGLLAVAILIANNLRDIPTDGSSGKRTLAVRLGEERTRRLYRICVIGSFSVIAIGALVHVYAPEVGVSPWSLLGLAAWIPSVKPMELVGKATGRELIPVLIGTARVHAVFGLLMTVGLFLSRHVGPPHPLHPRL